MENDDVLRICFLYIFRTYGKFSYRTYFPVFWRTYHVPYSPNTKLTGTVNLQTSCQNVFTLKKNSFFVTSIFVYLVNTIFFKSGGWPPFNFCAKTVDLPCTDIKLLQLIQLIILLHCLQDLYNWLEVEFNPLSLCNKMEAKLKVANINPASLVFSGFPRYL